MEYYIVDSQGNRVPSQGGGWLSNVETLSDDKVLTVADSGKTFLLDSVGEDITLPTKADGLSFKFRCIASVITSAWTITSDEANIEGYASVNYATVVAENETTINLIHTKAIAGDEVELVCDGTSWHVSGKASVVASLTFTVV